MERNRGLGVDGEEVEAAKCPTVPAAAPVPRVSHSEPGTQLVRLDQPGLRKGCASASGEAYVTLITNVKFLPGAVLLARTLHSLAATRPLIVMLTQECLRFGILWELTRTPNVQVCLVDYIPNPHHKPQPGKFFKFQHVYTKLAFFSLPLDVAVFLDADALPYQNIDHMFGMVKGEDSGLRLRAVCDCSAVRFMNTGVMVAKPNQFDFDDMLAKVPTLKSYDSSDQGFTNTLVLDGADCRNPDATQPHGFRRLPEVYGWQRNYACEYKDTVLQQWMGEQDYSTQARSQREQEGLAIRDHQHEFFVVHYVWPVKPWEICIDLATCDSGKGRGPWMDRWYFEAMVRHGVWGDDRFELGTAHLVSSDALSPSHIDLKCPDYSLRVAAEDAQQPLFHDPRLCDDNASGSEEEEEEESRALALALTNFAFATCDSKCVAWGTGDSEMAWGWKEEERCWKRDTATCFKGNTPMARKSRSKVHAVTHASVAFESALFLSPVHALCAQLTQPDETQQK